MKACLKLEGACLSAKEEGWQKRALGVERLFQAALLSGRRASRRRCEKGGQPPAASLWGVAADAKVPAATAPSMKLQRGTADRLRSDRCTLCGLPTRAGGERSAAAAFARRRRSCPARPSLVPWLPSPSTPETVRY
ncbi:hypothetical protein MRX96_058299 [Rhipicephalus microplus]